MAAIVSREGHRFEADEKDGFLYITLHLKGSKRGRNIGRVRLADRVLEVERKRDKHLMQKAQAYGFNEYVIRNGKTFDRIELRDDYGTYLFPRQLVIDMGRYLHFKEEGFEKQMFLSINIISNHKTENKI
jgi:hypothetical protein